MYDYCLAIVIPELVAPLAVSSTTTDSIAVLWTAPQYPPTGYILTIVCMLLCGDPLPSPSAPITNSSSTLATFTNIPASSECNITLTARYGTISSNELMVTASTLSEGE